MAYKGSTIIKNKETKTMKRLFRFTKTSFDRLEFLKSRYNTSISDVVDLLVEASGRPEVQSVLDDIAANEQHFSNNSE